MLKGYILKNIATLGPVGYLPIAPGTWGTAATLIAIALFKPSIHVYILATVAVTIIGTIASGEAEKALNKKDSGHIVIDEVAGYLISMAFLPYGAGYLIAAFFLFRAFDILKPPPLNKLQDLRGGFGVMLDDIAAGVYTNLVLQIWRAGIQR